MYSTSEKLHGDTCSVAHRHDGWNHLLHSMMEGLYEDCLLEIAGVSAERFAICKKGETSLSLPPVKDVPCCFYLDKKVS